MLTFLEEGFAANLVQGFRVYAWRAVPSLLQIALWDPSFALWPQPLLQLCKQSCVTPLEKWWDPISFQLIFSSSPTLELDAVGDAWRRWFQPRTKGWCLREGRLKKVSIFVFWNIFDSFFCGRLCFAFFVISHFYGLRPIIFEVQHLCGKIRCNHIFHFFGIKNDKEIFFIL